MHPSNAILIRPKDPEHYMDLVKHFRKIHETHDFAKYTQGTVQQSIPLRSLKNDIKHMSGGSLKNHANISSAKNKAFKKGDILMRRVGGTPQKGKYGTVGETFYIEEDSPKGELFKSPTKDELHQRYNAKLKQRLAEKRSKLPSIGEAWDTLNIGTRERVLNHSGEGGGGIPYKRLMDKDPYRDPHGGKDDFTRIRYVVGDPKKIEVKDINVKKGV